MDFNKQKENIGLLMSTKKYKLSFFGISPRVDWAIVFTLGMILIFIFSALFYFDRENIRKSISGDSLIREEKRYFDIEKAKVLLREFEKKGVKFDQTF